MKGIVTFALRRPVFILFLTFLVAIGGVVAYLHTPIEAYPDVTSTRTRVIVQWPGRSAEEVEKFITLPLTQALSTIPRKRGIRSISLFGLSVVSVLFEDDVDDFFAQQYTAARLSGVNLPEGAEAYLEPPYGATGEIFRYIVKGDRPIRDLYALQTWVIERQLVQVPGVADVVSFGGEEKIYEVQIDPARLQAYDLTPLDVIEALARSNINVGGDIVVRGDQAYVVRGIGLLESIQDIENVIITMRKNLPIYVKNVAHVTISAKPRLGWCGYNNIDDVVQGIVLMRRGEDPSTVIPRLKEKIHELNTRILPPGVKIEPFLDRTELVQTTVRTVTHNLIEGALLVALIVGLFLWEWRATMIIVSVIPLAFLAAILFLRLQGLPANLISMGALDFGLLLEGTLVIVESALVALVHLRKEVPPELLAARAKGGILRRVVSRNARYIFTAQIILILALLPIFLFERVEGKLFKPLAFTLGYAMLGALILSLTYVPAMLRLMYKTVPEEHSPRFIEYFLRPWKALPNLGWQNPRIVLILYASLVVGFVVIFMNYGSEFVPKLNEGALYVRGTLPISIKLEETVELAKQVKQQLLQIPEVRFVLFQAGRPNDGTDPTGFFNLELHVQLHPQEKWRKGITRTQLVEEVRQILNTHLGVRWAISQPIQDNVEEYVSGVKSSLAVKVYGQDLKELEKYAAQIAEVLRGVEGIEDLNLFQSLGLPELRIRLDELRMARYGVSMRDAQAVIEAAIGGRTATYFYEGERYFDVRVRLEKPYRDNPEVIKAVRVPTLTGRQVPLSEIADIRIQTGAAFIYREGSQRYVAIGFSVSSKDLGGTIAEAQRRVQAAVHLPRHISVTWEGEFESKQRATRQLSIIVPAVVGLILFVLYFHFGSAKEVLIAALTLPFAFIGGMTAWMTTGTVFGISAGVGMIILLGVNTINALILLGDLGGKSTLQAARETVVQRVRPLVMVMLIGSLGLLPAATSTRMGSEVQKPLAITIVLGMPVCLVLALVVLPALYRTFYRLSR
ncbi:MAG: CusA/CzcA family heavy metal efflux RND transporter [Bacteroidia bacterium]|nr:CusA/CzcA family heavy metal efflux RND transporter [Bacteroidia bacterium]MCX7764363.1 CusA/CzcA family heavy metal efflux RND transporter [Bacteroidia bacterium]MDW8057278.1 CusA/CzcA family heavy metal efflux RND transporter [Bacteroidia bacterium]